MTQPTDQSSREQEREALEKALDFIADHEDVIDGDNGPLPNRAMVLAAELRAVIAKAATLPLTAITAEEAGREGIDAEFKEGVAEEILRTYLALHKGKLGAHWMWCAIEQLVAGIPEAEVMSDYGYLSTPPSVPGNGEGEASPCLTLSAQQLKDALEFVAPDFETDEDQREAEVCMQMLSARMSTDGEHMPAGLWCWLAEYPEEGCIPLFDADAAMLPPAPAQRGGQGNG